MNKRYPYTLISLFALIFMSSCELYNPAEPTPAYIHIDKFILNTAYLTEGSNSHKITDAWVYIDDQLLGCFELPATFPVIAEGTHSVKIRPGIKVNGIAATRSPYPFYSKHEQLVDFQAGTTVTLTPSVSYLATTRFAFLEDFEGAGVTIAATSNSDTSFQEIYSITPDPNVFEGTSSGVAYIDATRTFFECATVAKYPLPINGSYVFLEFNYKCNYEFTVSVIAYGTSSSAQYTALNLNPSSNWNKAYIYLTPNVSGAFTAVDYKIAWGMLNSSGTDSAALLLDNIKLVY